MLAKVLACAATATVALTVCATPVAAADPNDGVAINGTYTAFSDGEWAKTNQSFHDEASVTQTWTITTNCTTYQDCTGRVISDQGWSADIVYRSGVWKVSRTVENWEQCDDGTAAPGQQAFTFWQDYPDRSKIAGWDQTIGPSGACGFSKWLNVRMPFTLTPVG